MADVLSTNLATAERMSGCKFPNYEQHIDYKLRKGNFTRFRTANESVEHLKNQYPELDDVLKPSEKRLEILKELTTLFVGKFDGMDVSRWGENDFNNVLSKVETLEGRLKNLAQTQEERDQYVEACKVMKDSVKQDGFNFCVDTYSWLETQLALAGEKNLVSKADNVGQIQEQDNSTSQADLSEAQERELARVAPKNRASHHFGGYTHSRNDELPVNVYLNEDAQFAQVLSANTLPGIGNAPLWGYGIALGGAYYGWMLWAGTSTLTSLVGVPLALAACASWSRPFIYMGMETIKDVYYRKEDGQYDVYFWKYGCYSRVQTVQSVSVLEGQNTQVHSFENCPFKVEGSATLAQLRTKGLPASLIAVDLDGKTHFMHHNFHSNKSWAQGVGL